MSELEGKIAGLEGLVAELQTALEQAQATIAERDGTIQSNEASIAGLEGDVGTHLQHIEAAVDRMNADRAAVENTKKASNGEVPFGRLSNVTLIPSAHQEKNRPRYN